MSAFLIGCENDWAKHVMEHGDVKIGTTYIEKLRIHENWSLSFIDRSGQD
jgi:hypothetical protein